MVLFVILINYSFLSSYQYYIIDETYISNFGYTYSEFLKCDGDNKLQKLVLYYLVSNYQVFEMPVIYVKLNQIIKKYIEHPNKSKKSDGVVLILS